MKALLALVVGFASLGAQASTCGSWLNFREQRVAASLMGLVYGDSFGALVEYWTPEQITAVFGDYRRIPDEIPVAAIVEKMGEKRLDWVRPLGEYTDDGQQALALVRVALAKPKWDASHRAHWRKLIVDGFSANAWRGIGKMFVQAGEKMKDASIDDRLTGSDSAGIGAAMRIGPLGAIYAGNDENLERAVVESTLMTHADIKAAAIAFAVARSVAWFVSGATAEKVRAELPAAVRAMELRLLACTDGWEFNRTNPHAVSDALAEILPTKENLVRRVLATAWGISGVKQSSPNAAYCLYGGVFATAMALADGEPLDLLAEIVRHGDDTDTVAAIAGSILGARHGSGWIPVHRLELYPLLSAYGTAMAKRAKLPEENDRAFLGREAQQTARSDAFGQSLRPR